jgi:hypothetical protein
VRWAEGKRKKDWNEHSFHSQKHRWFILDSVPALGFEDLGAHVVEAPFWRCRGSFSVPAVSRAQSGWLLLILAENATGFSRLDKNAR